MKINWAYEKTDNIKVVQNAISLHNIVLQNTCTEFVNNST